MHNSECDFERGEKDDTGFRGKIEFELKDTCRNRMSIATREWMKQFQIKVDDDEMKVLAIRRAAFHGEWNYSLLQHPTPMRLFRDGPK